MDQLWSKRFSSFVLERIFLLKRLANGFAFLPLIILLFGLYYYPIFLAWLPEQFPVEIFVTSLIAWVVAKGNFRSFLLESDINYLAPIEASMKSYFFKSYIYNVTVQAFFVLSIMIVLSPLFFARISGQFNHYLIFVLIMLLLKALNISVVWIELNTLSSLFILRLVLNFLFIYALLIRETLLVSVAFIFLLVLILGIKRQVMRSRVNWFRLVEIEQRIDARFYRWMGQFVDHTHGLSKVKQRRLLNHLVNMLRKTPDHAYSYLYLKLFFRTEMIGIVFRIVLLGMFILSLVGQETIQYLIYSFFLLLVGMQLSTFWHSFRNQVWPSLYPIPYKVRVQAFLSMSYKLLLLVAIFLLVPPMVQQFTLVKLLVLLSIAIVIPYSFIYWYTAKKFVQ